METSHIKNLYTICMVNSLQERPRQEAVETMKRLGKVHGVGADTLKSIVTGPRLTHSVDLLNRPNISGVKLEALKTKFAKNRGWINNGFTGWERHAIDVAMMELDTALQAMEQLMTPSTCWTVDEALEAANVAYKDLLPLRPGANRQSSPYRSRAHLILNWALTLARTAAEAEAKRSWRAFFAGFQQMGPCRAAKLINRPPCLDPAELRLEMTETVLANLASEASEKVAHLTGKEGWTDVVAESAKHHLDGAHAALNEVMANGTFDQAQRKRIHNGLEWLVYSKNALCENYPDIDTETAMAA